MIISKKDKVDAIYIICIGHTQCRACHSFYRLQSKLDRIFHRSNDMQLFHCAAKVRKIFGLFKQKSFDYLWIILIFQSMHPIGQGNKSIIGLHFTAILNDNLSLIVMFIRVMNGDTTLRIARIQHCLVHLITIHTFPAIFREQRRMDINHLVGISL